MPVPAVLTLACLLSPAQADLGHGQLSSIRLDGRREDGPSPPGPAETINDSGIVLVGRVRVPARRRQRRFDRWHKPWHRATCLHASCFPFVLSFTSPSQLPPLVSLFVLFHHRLCT